MKNFNKIISLITVAVLVLSMMAVPAFAATATTGAPVATGGEKIAVTYFSDSALSIPVTSVKTGDEVYAKITVNIPTGTFRSLNLNFAAENATIEENLNTFTAKNSSVMPIFELPAIGSQNTIAADKASANLSIAKKVTATDKYDSPTDWDEYELDGATAPWYSNIEIKSFEANAYKLKVTGTTGNVALKLSSSTSKLEIGEFNEGCIGTSFTVEDAGVTIGGSEPAKKKVSYSAAWTDSSVTYDESLADDALKAAMKANLTVKKLVDGTPETTEPAYDFVIDKTAKTIKVTITDTLLADEELADGAEKVFNLNFEYTAKPEDVYTLKSIKFGAEDITGKTEFDVDYTNYKNLGDIGNAITVTMLKNGTTDEVPAALGSDYVTNVKNVANTNQATVEIKFEGRDGAISRLKHEAAKTFVANWKNTEIVWSNVKVNFPDPFSFAKSTVSEKVIKDSITVTGDRKDGFKDVEEGIKLTEGVHYTVEVPADLKNGAEIIVKFNDVNNLSTVSDVTKFIEITEDEITWSDYEASFKDVTTFTGKETDDYIEGKVVVKALRSVNGTPDSAKTEISGYDVAITRAEGDGASKAVITFGDGEHKGAAVGDLTFTVQPNYDTVIATMTKNSFAEGATEEEILNALKVTAKKWFYGSDKPELAVDVTLERDSDYTAVLEGNTVRISGAGSEFNEVVGNTFTIVKGAKATAVIAFTNATDDKINKGTALKGKLSLDTTENIYGGKITLSTTKGEFDEFTINSNCEIKNVDKTVSGKYTFEFTKKAGVASVSDIGTFTINTDSMNKDDEIKVEVESIALDTVGGGDFVDVPSARGDAKTATVTETAPAPTEAKLPDASFDIKTLGALNSVIDRFKDAVTLVNTTDSSVVADAAALKAAITIDETDLNNKKLVIKDLVVPALSTTAYTYELAVAVPGYTKAKVTFTVTYNEATNDYNVTGGTVGEGAKKNTIYAGDNDSDNTITATSVTANDYANLVAKFGEAVTGNEAFDIYQNAETTIDRYDIMTMVWMFENYGMKLVSEAGIIAD